MRVGLVVLAATLLFALAGLMLTGCRQPESPDESLDWGKVQPLPTAPFDYHALTDKETAIARALQLYPARDHQLEAMARLTTRFNAVTWLDDATPIPGQYDPDRLAKPAWIVAIRGADGLAYVGPSGGEDIAGLYYVLSPADAMLITMGSATPKMIDRLTSLTGEDFDIVFETPVTMQGEPVPSRAYSGPNIVTTTPEP